MINSRLMYVSQVKDELRLAVAIEAIDELLGQAIYVEKVNQKISIYGEQNNPIIYVGREVMGREENLYNHDTVKIKDFSVGNEVNQDLSYQDFKSLIDETLSIMLAKDKSFFRIQLDLDNFQSAQVTLFDNLEKYIGPACA